ncbi:SsgA family sporulation/cell division regulator [Streptomyces sp. KL116D]|uniref:SsgA family sporulation/cell division regulator n=1 Tax=Streptomyces sp. KL116D TaxID=3045152 RepID=UPI0035573C61
MALRYDRHDPFAVRLAFHGPGGRSTQWWLSRDLLMTGSEPNTVHGDVLVWPSWTVRATRYCCCACSDDANALIEVRRGPLRHWLAQHLHCRPCRIGDGRGGLVGGDAAAGA